MPRSVKKITTAKQMFQTLKGLTIKYNYRVVLWLYLRIIMSLFFNVEKSVKVSLIWQHKNLSFIVYLIDKTTFFEQYFENPFKKNIKT